MVQFCHRNISRHSLLKPRTRVRIVVFRSFALSRWREAASSLADLVLPGLMSTLLPPTDAIDTDLRDLPQRINLLSIILRASLGRFCMKTFHFSPTDHNVFIDISGKNLKALKRFLKHIAVSSWIKVIMPVLRKCLPKMVLFWAVDCGRQPFCWPIPVPVLWSAR